MEVPNVVILISYHHFHRDTSGKQYSYKVLFSGDYELLCHMYGLSGASGMKYCNTITMVLTFITTLGRHCCLWCEITSDKLKTPRQIRGRSASRTLDNIRQHHGEFLSGGGNIKNAKHHFNVIAEHFFDIPVDCVR